MEETAVLEDLIISYYTGSGTNKYACEIRNNIKKNLLIFDENHKQISSEEKIDDEYLDGFGVVRIEFPAANIRNEFYKEGSLILGIGVFAYAFSFLPESVFMEAQSLYSMLGFMRNLSYLVIAIDKGNIAKCGSNYWNYLKKLTVLSKYAKAIIHVAFMK